MTWVVDTCIILDILDRHPEFAEMSARALQSKLDDVLAIAPITYVLNRRYRAGVMRKHLPLLVFRLQASYCLR